MNVELLDTPVGRLRLVSDGVGLVSAHFVAEGAGERPEDGESAQPDDVLRTARVQFEEYFAGERQVFDVPLAPAGTAFRQRVWSLLREIGYGRTSSYGRLAAELGNPRASRAVGLANGANPIAVIVPCHRVIGADGKLTGYAGGLDRKRWLLAHEARHAVRTLF